MQQRGSRGVATGESETATKPVQLSLLQGGLQPCNRMLLHLTNGSESNDERTNRGMRGMRPAAWTMMESVSERRALRAPEQDIMPGLGATHVLLTSRASGFVVTAVNVV